MFTISSNFLPWFGENYALAAATVFLLDEFRIKASRTKIFDSSECHFHITPSFLPTPQQLYPTHPANDNLSLISLFYPEDKTKETPLPPSLVFWNHLRSKIQSRQIKLSFIFGNYLFLAFLFAICLVLIFLSNAFTDNFKKWKTCKRNLIASCPLLKHHACIPLWRLVEMENYLRKLNSVSFFIR